MSKRSFISSHQVLLCSVALAVFAGAASAQPAPPPPPADQDPGKIEKVTVTAQKRKQNAQDIPGTVDALNGKAIKDLGITSSDKIAEFIPGVTISLPSGQGNQPIIAIRGIGNNDFNTNNAGPNGIYSDEVYLSAPSSQTFLTFDLDRIEVLKGPQGTLYGRNTSGGAINFISNKPVLDEFGMGATASYSSYDTWQAEGFVNAATGDTSAARIAAIWNSSDGFMRNLVNGERVSGTDGYAGRFEWLVKPAEGLDVLFNVHGSKTDTLPTEYHQVGAVQFNGVGFDPCSQADISSGACTDIFFYNGPTDFYKGNYNRTQHLDNESTGGSVRADWDMGDVTFTSISALEHNDKLHPEDSDASPNNLLEINFGVNSDTFTQEFRLAGERGETMHWLVGLYYLGETLKQDQSIDLFIDLDNVYGLGAGICPAIINVDTQFCAQTGTSHSNQKTTAYAAFGQTDFEIFDKTRLTLGGRYTNEKKDFRLNGSIIGETAPGVFGPPQTLWFGGFDDSIEKSAFSWKVALDHHFTEKVMAYASFSTGFKSGGFNGGFLDVNFANASAQVAPVRSENNNAYELGFKADLLDDTFRLNASAFYYDYKDLQVHTLVNPPGGFPADVLDNAQKATIKGVDVEAIAKPVDNLTLRVSAEWLEATLEEYTSSRGPQLQDFSGNTLPNAPEFSLTGIADYTIPLGNSDAIDFLASASYRSKVFFDPGNDPLIAQDGYWVVDARAAYTIDDGKWQLAIFGRNLTDETYTNMAFNLQSSFGLLQEIVAPPLTVGVEASFRY